MNNSFENYTNYKDNAGVSGVVFGSEKPLLEVELNEMQEIQKTHMRNVLHNMIGDGTTNLSSIKYTGGKLTVTDSMFSIDGIVVQCDSLSLSITNGSAYLQVWEEDADYTSVLKKNGNEQSTETVSNWFKDTRSIVETTKRKVVRYNLTNTTDPTKHNLKIADFSNGVMTLVVKEIDIAKAIQELQNQFNNLQIGGRNILRYSDNFKIDNSRVSGWNNAGSLSILQEDGEYIAKVSASGRTTNVINSLYSSYYPCKKGDKFVASVWFRITDISAWDVKKPYVFEVYDANDNRVQYTDVDIADTNTNNPTVVNGEWVRMVSTHTVTTDNASKVALRLTLFKNGEISFKKPQLEFGTKDSDWTPAPEDVQDQINSIQNPPFDDSGTVQEISSFTDFLNSVKTKMNIFQFFRDFKAGMKYVLHTGRLVNNAVTTEEGFALDARMGKVLQDQILDVNKNINGREIMKHLPFNSTELNTINIDDASGNFVAGFTNDVTEGTFPNKSWQNIVQFDTYHFRSQFSVTSDGRGGHPKPAIRSWWGSVWSDWYSLVTNNDLEKHFVSQEFVIDNDYLNCVLFYTIKLGICYVFIRGMTTKRTGEHTLIKNDMPKAASDSHIPVFSQTGVDLGKYLGGMYIDYGTTNLKINILQTGTWGYSSFSYPIFYD